MNKEKLLILGGNTDNNIQWIQRAANFFKKYYEVDYINYNHWKKHQSINLEEEIVKTVSKIGKNTNTIILSKSVGSIVTLLGVERGLINPKKIIILGFPLRYIEKNKIEINSIMDKVIKKTKVIIIQQKNDPIGKYQEVYNLYNNKLDVFEIPGNYHIYSNFQGVYKIILKWR